MFQTAGHALVAAYAAALSVPVYRAPVRGTARDRAREYRPPPAASSDAPDAADAADADAIDESADADAVDESADATADETESLVPLLRRVRRAHPAADAVSAGAVLSTYQRTRVESVAARLGLVPLAYLWQYPALPFAGPPPSSLPSTAPPVSGPPSADPVASGLPSTGYDGNDGAARLLADVAALGLDARVVKVASGGLDAGFLWGSLREETVRRRMEKAVGRFGGSALGEGGEYETLVLEGPGSLWRGRLAVAEAARVERLGEGGEAWLEFRGASVEPREREGDEGWREKLSRPALWSAWIDCFDREARRDGEGRDEEGQDSGEIEPPASLSTGADQHPLARWDAQLSVAALPATLEIANLAARRSAIEAETGPADTRQRTALDIRTQTEDVCAQLRAVLHAHGLAPAALLATTLLLRDMADFGAANAVYGGLFPAPLPPARVTVAAGAAVPPGCRLLLHATASRLAPERRTGLHVQSRSHWAPANIGPYAQAISLAAAADALALVFVAGQIPLVPATMALVAAAPAAAFRVQAQLALQHLWAVGAAVDVAWWTHGLAYLAADPDAPPGRARANVRTAWRLWCHVHRSRAGDVAGDVCDVDADANADESWELAPESAAVDLWELRHGRARHDGFVAAPAARPPDLPDFACVNGAQAMPAFFAVEVAELPRGARVEWHSLGTSSRTKISSAVCRSEGLLEHRFETGVEITRTVACVGVLLMEGWEGRFERCMRGLGLWREGPGRVGSDEAARAESGETAGTESDGEVGMQGASSSTTVYTPFPALASRCRVAVVPCTRVWAGNAEELAAAIVTRTEE